MTTKRPQLATDADFPKVEKMMKKERFCILPKIDGVRGMYMWDQTCMTGRSLKTFGNMYTTGFFTRPTLKGMDGEFAAERETHPDLCRLTTSATSTIAGQPWLMWHLFDYITPETEWMDYEERHFELSKIVGDLKNSPSDIAAHLQVVPYYPVASIADIEAADQMFLDQGYEGSIIRSLERPVKFGRCTPNQGFYLRLKRFIQEDAVVLELQEAMENTNEATVNELGLSERSSHQENKIEKGMVGALICRDIKTGETIKVGPGNMTHEDRTFLWNHPQFIVGKTISYKHFPKGVKDKPRFPTFVTVRDPSDLV